MAENKTGGAAGIFAKRVQKQLSRAQEKVLQRLGKTVETKDEQFEQCSQNLSKQQSDGNKLYKDVKAYFNAVKVMHETSKRLSQTLKDVYEPDWQGGEDLTVIMESEDLLWNDYEEKLADQTVRTMETYMSQFPDLKERVAKRGRKLVDYDSARHHLEALQNTKKKDEAKMAKAEEEFNKAQSVFEEINNELREELPAVYHSRIGCYVTVFQNISNLRDVFYKEMSKLNHELYNVMTKLENQHSDKVFIIKGVTSKRRSLMISAPIPCNTAFPPAESSLNENATPHPAQNGKESDSAGTEAETAGANETSVPGEEQANGSTPAPEAPPPDDTPPEARESEADLGSRAEAGEDSAEEESGEHQGGGPAEAAEESGGYQTDKSAPAEDAPKETASSQDEPTGSASGDTSPVGSDQPAIDPATASDSSASLSRTEQEEGEEADSAPDAQESAPTASPEHTPEGTPEGTPDTPDPELMQAEESESPASPDPEDDSPHEAGEGARDLPPGFLYKAVALKDHLTEEAGQLLFQEGEIILVIADAEQRPEGTATGVKERDWLQHRNPSDHKGTFPESLIERADPSPQV